VTEAVVERLEVVEIQEQDRVVSGRSAFRPGDRVLDPVPEQAAVREPGQGIVEGLRVLPRTEDGRVHRARLRPVVLGGVVLG
jgi:hypothetical protein